MKFLSTNPSAILENAGPHAALTADLFWYFLALNTAVFILVTGFLFYSIWKRREKNFVEPEDPGAETERRLVIGVSSAVAVTFLILTSFVVKSYIVDQKLTKLDRDPTMEIEVTARQWWWEIRYMSRIPSEVFTTANEIHVPVNEKVRLILKSGDVIHSIWFPNLSGKKDILPGHNQDLYIEATRTGVWEGRCAEFCGLQHAKMGLKLFSETRESFEAWKSAQRQPAFSPATAEEKKGQEIFQKGSCILCHTIRETGTTGYSSTAPELTHLKSRTTLASGAVKNTREHLASWVSNPQKLKPGVHMPVVIQNPENLKALLNYLETLK